jgi:hypothetical protein
MSRFQIERLNIFVMDTILQLIQDQPWFAIVTGVIALASAIASMTPTPKPGSIWAKVYAVIDFLALNIGRAKEKASADKEAEKKD